MSFRISMLVVCICFLAVSARAAESTPVQLSLFNPLQLFPEETGVEGIRINLIYGVNSEVRGLDYGVVNRTTGATHGAQVGALPFAGVNITERLSGVQLAGVMGGVNYTAAEVEGLQMAGIFAGFSRAGNVNGAQISGILAGMNKAADLTGVQVAGMYLGINLANNVSGLQLGSIYNQADTIEGVQLGLVNICNKMKGIQLGLVNVIKQSSLPFFPIVNASF